MAAIAGLCLFNLRITGFELTYIPGDSGDARFINYLLEHGYLSFSGQHAFWDAPFMYPQPHVLAFSDNMLGTLPVYSLFRLMGSDRETAYQLWWMSISLLNFAACYFVLFKLCRKPLPAALGAFIFAFGLFNQSQMSFLQMNIRFGVPLILYYAWLSITQPALKNYLLYCLWMIVQFYCIIYTGFLAFYLSLFFMAVTLMVYRKKEIFRFYFRGKNLVYFTCITIATATLLYLLLKPYIEISEITGLRMFREVVPTLPMAGSWFFSHESAYTWSFLSGHLKNDFPEWQLHYIFPGILPLIAFLWGGIYLLRQRIKKQKTDRLLLVFFIATLTTFLLFLRTSSGYTLYALIFKLPGMNSLRVLSRVIHVELFMMLALFALLVTYGFERLKKQKQYIAAALLVLAVLADNAFDAEKSLRTDKTTLRMRTEKVVEMIKADNKNGKKTMALVCNSGQAAYLTHLDAMMAAQELQMNCINGYTSYCPDDYGPFFLNANGKGLELWISKRKIDTAGVLVIRVNR